MDMHATLSGAPIAQIAGSDQVTGRTRFVAVQAARHADVSGLRRGRDDEVEAFLDPLPVREIWGLRSRIGCARMVPASSRRRVAGSVHPSASTRPGT